MTGRRISLRALLAILLLASLSPHPAAAQSGDCSRDSDWATIRARWVTAIVALTNAHRASIGLHELAVSRSLTSAALWKASHMAAYEYMEHDDPAPPVDRTWEERVEACGYQASAGENIAYGYRTPEEMFQGWLDSPGHRANIERDSFDAVGVGVATNDSGITYWAQVFGGEDDSANDAHDPPQPGADTVEGAEDRRIRFFPLANDLDPNGDPMELIDTSAPVHGTVTVSAEGEVTYIPERDFFGEDSFTYSVIDVFGLGSESGVTVSVLGVNDAPDARGERVRVRAGRAQVIEVLANDRDVEDDRLELDRIVRDPRIGKIVDVDRTSGTIEYKAPARAAGLTDRIVYRVSDGNGGFDRATMRLKIRR